MKNKAIWITNIILLTALVAADIMYMTIKASPYILKTLASAIFVFIASINFIYVFKNDNKKSYKYLMLIGTLFAFGGDVFLIDHFVIGAALFAIGHVFYLISFCLLVKPRWTDLFIFLGIMIFALLVIFLYPFSFNGMMPLVIVYAVIISLMLAKAIGNAFAKSSFHKPMIFIAIGAFLFFFSDLCLLFNVFGNLPRIMDILCLGTYYPAQGFLACSILYMSSCDKINGFQRLAYRNYQLLFRAILPLLPYRKPQVLTNNAEVIEVLKNQNLASVLFVTDKTIKALGLCDSLLNELKKAKIKVNIFDEVVANPTISVMEKGLTKFKEKQCDCLIALGGGSVMDCAKMIGARSVKNIPIEKMKGLLKICKKLPCLIAIPTTAGTGSETTLAAVVTDDKTHNKFAVNDFSLIPHYALLDANLTLGLNSKITATTGMDALTHAIEAYIGRSTTKQTRAASLEAIKLIYQNIEKVYKDGSNLEARKNMLKASFLAGVAFTQSYVGYVHAIAHSLGGAYNTPHGLANAVILPVMLRVYGKCAEKSLASIAKFIGLSDSENIHEASEKFIEYIEKLNKKFGIPNHFEELKKEDIPSLAIKAANEANPLYPVPELYNNNQLEEIYLKLIKI